MRISTAGTSPKGSFTGTRTGSNRVLAPGWVLRSAKGTSWAGLEVYSALIGSWMWRHQKSPKQASSNSSLRHLLLSFIASNATSATAPSVFTSFLLVSFVKWEELFPPGLLSRNYRSGNGRIDSLMCCLLPNWVMISNHRWGCQTAWRLHLKRAVASLRRHQFPVEMKRSPEKQPLFSLRTFFPSL